ncbi:cell wall hydrolase [Novosphingobium sp.]|uniref:cell wall hydrolase n=1 Tax=Novosphingobium sp. TaxID=1874826 RepID=UPI0038B93E2E
MSRSLRIASAISITATFFAALLGTTGAGAESTRQQATDLQVLVREAPGASPVTSLSDQPTVRVEQQDGVTPNLQSIDNAATLTLSPPAASLAAAVDATPAPSALSDELHCLATAIYFEAKSETLAGQLAVGRVVVARARSGRFPASYCGVVLQPSQFSFVRGRALPAVDRSNRGWLQAAKVAMIADSGAWKSPVEGAMYFHAARVGPVSGKTRMARIDNHVFYR